MTVRATLALLLSTLDAALTLYIVESNIGYEVNPLLAAALAHSYGMFVAVKLTITVLCVQVFERWCPRATWFVVALFGAVATYSIWGLCVIT